MNRPSAIDSATVNTFVRAAHGDLDTVRTMLHAQPALANAGWDWGGGDYETALQAAAHTGSAAIARLLLAHGARMDIYAAAMLGLTPIVQAFIDHDSTIVHVPGAHGIPLLVHAKIAEQAAVVALVEATLADLAAERAAHAALNDEINAFAGHLQTVAGPPVQAVVAASPLEPAEIGPLNLMHLAGGPVPADAMRRRFPYMNAGVFEPPFDALVEKGYAESADGLFQLTAAGTAEAKRFLHAYNQTLADHSPLAESDARRMGNLLGRILAAARADDVIDGWSLAHSAPLQPDSPGFVQLERAAANFNAWRDDAHLAAWRPLGVSAPAWEALTFIWRDGPQTADGLAERLPFRRVGADGYAAALVELGERGWVDGGNGGFKLTDAGQQVRDRAEAATDRYYYRPFRALSTAEIAEASALLTQVNAALAAAAEQADA